jgi:hypothetical protein
MQGMYWMWLALLLVVEDALRLHEQQVDEGGVLHHLFFLCSFNLVDEHFHGNSIYLLGHFALLVSTSPSASS